MKKLLLTILTVLVFISCKDDENIISGIAVSFFPVQVADAVEEDGITYIIEMEASGSIGNQDAFAEISVELSDDGAIFTEPALDGGMITVPFQQDTVDSGNGPRVRVVGSFQVTVLNDIIPNGYEVDFVITGTGGAITAITQANRFTLRVDDNDTAPIFADDFENGLDNWTIISAGGSNSWVTTSFNDNTAALSSTFNSSSPVNEDNWLISPAINFDETGSETLNFISKTRFNDEGNRLEVSVLTNYDGVSSPSTATQTILNPTLDPHTGAGFGDFTPSGDLDLTSVTGTGYIAFRFKAVNANDGAGWEVDDVELSVFDPDASSGGSGTGGGGGGQGSGNAVSLPYTDGFEVCTEFEIPTGWVEYNAPGTNTDRGWGCRDFSRTGSWAVQASANSGDASADDAWLISENPFDLTSVSNAYLNFWVESFFDGDGGIELLYSSNYDGSGDPSSSNWVTVTDANNQLPAAGSGGFNEITTNLTDAIGNEIYIAFRYQSSTSNSSSWTLDDLSFTETDPGSGGGGGGGGTSMDIADVRSMSGQTVTITGIVTTPDYGFNNGQYFIQDATGGINVFHSGNFGLVSSGDEVTITGSIGDFSSQIQISPTSVVVNSSNNTLPAAVSITESDIDVSGQFQGMRVTISGVSLDDESLWPVDPISSSSGVSIPATVGTTSFEIRIDRGESFQDGSALPNSPFSITGILGRFEDNPQILPFFESDIQD